MSHPKLHRLVRFAGTLGAGMLLAAAAPAPSVLAGPPPFAADPSKMSGIPRPEPKLAAGVVTVRCLGTGGFSDPAVGVDVTLEVQGKAGADSAGISKMFTAKTQEQGRATFDQLGEYVGGLAVATVTLGGKPVRSLPIELLPSSGTAVMLVEGAKGPGAGPAAGAPPKAPAGQPEIPPPGNAFPLERTPKGTLTVGTFDLEARKPLGNVEIKLTLTPPEGAGESSVRTGTSDPRGKFIFEGLGELPAGTTLLVEATLVEGGELRKSLPFEMDEKAGMALVLAEGADKFIPPGSDPHGGQAQPQKPSAELPGPRILKTMPMGTVRIRVVDFQDQPIANHPVMVVKKTATGSVDKYRGTTKADGSVEISGIKVQQDALYFVESFYSSAPYQSRFFGMDKRGGISVNMRLYETTNDTGVLRSALQFDVTELENDMAQIVQIYEVMVSGDKAYWNPKFEIRGPDDAKAFTVLRPAEDHLDHEEKAPFATLHGPIPPGVLTNLSVGYLLPHTGAVDIAWDVPFEVIQASVLVGEDFELTAANAEKTELSSPVPNKVVWKLPPPGVGGSVAFSMSGLRIRNPLYRQVAFWGGVGTLFAVVGGFLFTRRRSLEDQLAARADELEKRLREPGLSTSERVVAIKALDEVARQLDTLRKPEGSASAKPAAS